MSAPLAHKFAEMLHMPLIETPRWVRYETAGAHEGGHGIVAVVLGTPLEELMVTSGGDGLTTLASNPRGRRDVILSLAGPVAESRWLNQAGIVENALVVGCEADFRDAWASTPGTGSERVANLIELYGATERIVAQHWPAIMEVAAQLMVRRYVRADAVYEMCGG